MTSRRRMAELICIITVVQPSAADFSGTKGDKVCKNAYAAEGGMTGSVKGKEDSYEYTG